MLHIPGKTNKEKTTSCFSSCRCDIIQTDWGPDNSFAVSFLSSFFPFISHSSLYFPLLPFLSLPFLSPTFFPSPFIFSVQLLFLPPLIFFFSIFSFFLSFFFFISFFSAKMELRGLLSEEQRGEGMGEELSGEGLVNKYALLTKREVKTAGYWPSSLLFKFLRTETKLRSIKMQKRTTLISSHLDWTSLVNKGLIIHAAKRFSFIQNHECLSFFFFWLSSAVFGVFITDIVRE